MKKEAQRMDPVWWPKKLLPQPPKLIPASAAVPPRPRRWRMQLNDDFLTQWEHIIADVNKTDVPLECIKKVVIKLAGSKQKTINVTFAVETRSGLGRN
jgi:hypothetical protein